MNPGDTRFVPRDTAPLIYYHQDGAAAAAGETPSPGSTRFVPAQTLPPLWFEFRAAAVVATPGSVPVTAPVPAVVPTVGGGSGGAGRSSGASSGAGRSLAATGWQAPVPALLMLGLGWVLRRRLAADAEPQPRPVQSR